MHCIRLLCTAALAATLFGGGPAARAAIVFVDSGANVSDLTDAADQLATFRSALGANLGAAPNPANNPGRREINWDAPALDGVADPNLMPADQFNRLAAPFARGAQFATPGTGFMLSRRCEQDGATPPCGGNNILLGLGPDAGQNVNFRAFSEQRIFTPVGSNVMDVSFAVPGWPAMTAVTTAFGAIFVDVETDSLTSMEFFDPFGNSLGSFFVPAAPDAGFSFLGALFDGGEQVARVRITLGDMLFLGHGQFGTVLRDLAALDDFIYAEPQLQRIPEPSLPALMALAALGALAARRRRAGAAAD